MIYSGAVSTVYIPGSRCRCCWPRVGMLEYSCCSAVYILHVGGKAEHYAIKNGGNCYCCCCWPKVGTLCTDSRYTCIWLLRLSTITITGGYS